VNGYFDPHTTASTTSAASFLGAPGAGISSFSGMDILVRVVQTTGGPNATWIRETAAVSGELRGWALGMQADLAQLRSLALWQHRLLDYNAVYQAYLLEQMTEDEFEAEAEKFVVDHDHVDIDVLAPQIDQLLRLTGIAYTPSDLVAYFHCEHDDVMSALDHLKEVRPEIAYLLPEIEG
jgi:hypothetical protein